MKVVERTLRRNFLNLKSSKGSALLWSLATLLVCLIMSIVYWETAWGDYLAASPIKVFEGKEYWRLFTSSLIHADLSHYLSNSLMLGVMGYFVYDHYRAWMFPALAFTVGVLINLIVIWTYPPEVSLVGASGVVYYLWGFWLILYICIQKHIPFIRRLMKVSGVGLFVLIPSEFHPNVSYYAHAVGLVLGIIFGLIYYLWNRKYIHSFEVWVDEVYEIDDELTNEALNFKQEVADSQDS